MTGRVAGKVALVTGAARGQGRAHAIKLAEHGADVIAIDVCAPIGNMPYPAATPADLAETARLVSQLDRRVVVHEVDTRDDGLAGLVAGSVTELGRLDIVVANAGIGAMAAWDEVTPQLFRDTIDVNLYGTWNTVMACAPHLIAGGGGSVILTSSVAGLKALPFLLPYTTSKHGVTGMTRAFAHELATHNIRVNSLHPTGVNTAMSEGAGPETTAATLERNPRLAGMFTNSLEIESTDVEDQANAVLFLASDESRYVTALAMTVDAGNSQY